MLVMPSMLDALSNELKDSGRIRKKVLQKKACAEQLDQHV